MENSTANSTFHYDAPVGSAQQSNWSGYTQQGTQAMQSTPPVQGHQMTFQQPQYQQQPPQPLQPPQHQHCLPPPYSAPLTAAHPPVPPSGSSNYREQHNEQSPYDAKTLMQTPELHYVYPPQSMYPPAEGYPTASPYGPGPVTTQPTATQPTTKVVNINSRAPCELRCPFCSHYGLTHVTHETGTTTWVAAGITCLFLPCCCCIPFCVDGLKDAQHRCAKCNQIISLKKPNF